MRRDEDEDETQMKVQMTRSHRTAIVQPRELV